MMQGKSWWSALFARTDPGRPRLRLQVLGLGEHELRGQRPLWIGIGDLLALQVEVDTRGGDIVLADRSFAARTAPRQLASICRARPLITCDFSDPPGAEAGARTLFERRQRELLRQLRDIPLVRGVSTQFSASGWGQEVIDASDLPLAGPETGSDHDAPCLDRQETMLVTWLLRGMIDPTIKPMVASYGANAVLKIDFAQSFALVDPLAQQHLRVRRELPRLATTAVPGPDAIERPLDSLVWDVGIATGGKRLLNQPENWWHTPLATCSNPAVQRYTRLPRYLELAAVLFDGPASPADLHRLTGRSAAEMRPFLQACLYLGLAWWAPDQ